MKKELLWVLKLALVLLATWLLVLFLFDSDPWDCLGVIKNGQATWREWVGSAVSLVMIFAGLKLIEDKKEGAVSFADPLQYSKRGCLKFRI